MSSDGITPTVVLGAIAAVGSVIAATVAILNYRMNARKNKPVYTLRRFDEHAAVMVSTSNPNPRHYPPIHKIQLLHPSIRLKKCMILFNDTPLIWDSSNTTSYTIEEGGGSNATIPEEIFKTDGIVKIKTNNKVIETLNFQQIEETL